MNNLKRMPMASTNEFTTNEAFKLMEQLVQKKTEGKDASPMNDLGVISGLLMINDEVEIVVKFFDGLAQYTKEEFVDHLDLVSAQ